MSSVQELTHEGANLRAAKKFAKLVAVAIVLIVAGYGDVMYIQAMSGKFPDGGPLLLMCYIGAFTSFLAVGYLLLGKSLAFRPGGQMLAAWVVFVVELAVIALNIILVYNPHPVGIMASWAFFAPATPVVHMLGVALIYFLDPDLGDKHHAMELKSDMDRAERNQEYATFKARINLRQRQTEHLTKALESAVNSPESLAYIRQYGYAVNMALLTELTGVPAPMVPSAPDVPALGAPGQTGRVSSTEAAKLDQKSVEPAAPVRAGKRFFAKLGDAVMRSKDAPQVAASLPQEATVEAKPVASPARPSARGSVADRRRARLQRLAAHQPSTAEPAPAPEPEAPARGKARGKKK